ncbi:ABC transporter ATP-binding protein [Bacillus sp. OK048]|uniref:ABC transporter ATP-binding protein n=1 Tax=Bacillus sp. OK048 TaxID=1882761 RepID=UPI000884FA43|nr:ABC transporter ATP-binding protein [Bacillus sp. OK048]SDN57930.1 ABC-2 type transport system ATP-binding protein [Bacillus sp. OK048]
MLKVENLKKSFGNREVVRGVTFSVNKGESFGLLGPNGAGKSTTISMICGLIASSSGDVTIGGVSIKQNPMEVKRKIGVVPQDIALYPTISARENLYFWGRMYGLSRGEAKKRTEEVLEIVGLQDRAKEKIENYSGGMKRRINIGAALMHKPELLIMDEPTVGIDPQSRNHILETVKKLNQEGMTVIYTSHYMEEVEYLCERIAIVDQGLVIASGTKADLCNRLMGATSIQVKVNASSPDLINLLGTIQNVQSVKADGELITIYASDARQALGDVVAIVVQSGLQVLSVEVQEPNLETVFLQLTGRTLRD